MPFTLSHPAAVLPLRRLGLPMTALVMGSMVPDVPLFVGWQRGYDFSHSLLGVPTIDAAMALVAVWLWFMVAREALVDLAPDMIRSRLDPRVGLTHRQWLLAVPAVWVGSLTHVLWDGFTHSGGWGVEHLAWLQPEHAGLPGYRWAQYVSGVLGLAIVCVTVVRYLQALPPVVRATPRPAWADRLLLAAAAVIATSIVVTAALNRASGFHSLAFNTVVIAILTTLVSVAALCLAWRGTRRAG